MLKIGDFAKLGRVSVKALRYYGQLGLLTPAWVDRFTGYRYYALDQLPQLNRILALKDLGFSLDQVRHLLQSDLPAAEIRDMLRTKRAELECAVQRERARLERVETRLLQMEHEGQMPTHEVILKSVPAFRVLGVRGVILSFEDVSVLFQRLDRYLLQHGLGREAAAPRVAILHDAGTHMKGVDAEVAAPTTAVGAASPPAVVHELPAVREMACVAHPDGHESLGEAYRAGVAWMERSGYGTAGPTRELYLHAHQVRSGIPSLRTRLDEISAVIEVQFPVEKKPVSGYVLLEPKGAAMEPKLVKRPAFSVVGMEYRGSNENDEIKQLWGEFWPRVHEIRDINWANGSYGVCRDWPEGEGLDYLAAVEVDRAEQVPHDMTSWQVPENTYAVFPCTLPTLHEAYRYAFEDWLPQSGYTRADGPDHELYSREFDPEDPSSRMYIYIPVRA